jgi:four helix bundle protein
MYDRPLDHERLDVYTVAVSLDKHVTSMARQGGRGHSWIWDQAQRASGSTALNVGEGCGREGADRRRCFRIARGSALETDVALTLAAHRGLCSEEDRRIARELSVRVVSMLTRLLRDP